MSSLSFMLCVHVTERRLSLLTSCSQAAGVCLSLITGVFSGSLSRKGIFCDFFLEKYLGRFFLYFLLCIFDTIMMHTFPVL